MSTQSTINLPSLLDEPATSGESAGPRAGESVKRPGPISLLRTRLRAGWHARMDDPSRRPKFVKQLRIAGVAAGLLAITGAYFALRPTPQPDYLADPLNTVFDYTLLTDEFNNLPVEKRLELLGMLVGRLKNMSAGDSSMLAAFAAGIAGSARAQIEKNVSILVVDAWDKYARDYDDVPVAQRGEFLDKTFLDMMKTMEAVTGQPRDISDEKRLAEVREQTKKNQAMMNDPNRAPDAKSMGGMLSMMDSNLGGRSSPAQRARGGQLMRDMAIHFRSSK